MRAHLIKDNGNQIMVQVPETVPRIVEHGGADFALTYPGFAYFGDSGIGQYVEYREAKPLPV